MFYFASFMKNPWFQLWEKLRGNLVSKLKDTILFDRTVQKKSYHYEIDRIEQERQRIARDLHDEALQIFGAIQRKYGELLPHNHRDPFIREIEMGQKAIDSAINELHPPVLCKLGLVEALEQYIERFNQSQEMEVHYNIDLHCKLNKRVKLTLFRIVQECLTNILKHAQTKKAEVILRQTKSNRLWLQVSDEGCGFVLEKNSKRYGLIFIKERVEEIEGELTIQSCPNEGTTIICQLDLSSHHLLTQ